MINNLLFQELHQGSINLKDVIDSRRSCRSFQVEPIEDDKIEKLKSFIEKLAVPFDHQVQVDLFQAQPTKKLYTIFNAPKINLAISSLTDYVSISKAGFVGQMVILYATSLGISTCWYGHYHLNTMEDLMPHLGNHKNDKNPRWSYGKEPVEGRRVICISPLAYWKNTGLRLVDRLQEKTISFKRKPIKDLLVDTDILDLNADILYALDYARKAPSAGNGQFWRFKVQSNTNIQVAMPIGYKHLKWEHPNVDIGITVCHLYLGLVEKGYKVDIHVYEDQGRGVWSLELTR